MNNIFINLNCFAAQNLLTMKKTILKYGLSSGFIISAFMIISMLLHKEGWDFTSSMYYGFTMMLVALSLIFFALSNFRKNEPEKYNYKNGLFIGLGISLLCSIMYVITWDIAFNNFVPDFMVKYSEFYLKNLEAKGVSTAEFAEAKEQMAEYVKMYDITWYRMGVTFTEIFPMGLLVSVIAPIIIRKKK